MNKLFEVIAGDVVLNADALAIEPFKALWDLDATKSKSQATKEIAYIVYMHKWDSIYRSAYSPVERESKIKKDLFGDEKFKVKKEVEEAAVRYLELQETTTTRLLKAAEGQIEVLIKRFEEVSKDTDTLDIIKAMEKIGPLVKSIAMLKKQAQLEQLGESRVRGGIEVDVFNTPKSSFIHK